MKWCVDEVFSFEDEAPEGTDGPQATGGEESAQ